MVKEGLIAYAWFVIPILLIVVAIFFLYKRASLSFSDLIIIITTAGSLFVASIYFIKSENIISLIHQRIPISLAAVAILLWAIFLIVNCIAPRIETRLHTIIKMRLDKGAQKELVKQAYTLDIKNGITSKGKELKNKLGNDINNQSQFFKYSSEYFLTEEIVKHLIGTEAVPVSLGVNLSFVNYSPAPVFIDEIFLLIKNEKYGYIFKPMIEIDEQGLIKDFENKLDYVGSPYHPLFIQGRGNVSQTWLFINIQSRHGRNETAPAHILPGSYDITLIYRAEGKTKRADISKFNITAEQIVKLAFGTSQSNEDSVLLKELEKEF